MALDPRLASSAGLDPYTDFSQSHDDNAGSDDDKTGATSNNVRPDRTGGGTTSRPSSRPESSTQGRESTQRNNPPSRPPRSGSQTQSTGRVQESPSPPPQDSGGGGGGGGGGSIADTLGDPRETGRGSFNVGGENTSSSGEGVTEGPGPGINDAAIGVSEEVQNQIAALNERLNMQNMALADRIEGLTESLPGDSSSGLGTVVIAAVVVGIAGVLGGRYTAPDSGSDM